MVKRKIKLLMVICALIMVSVSVSSVYAADASSTVYGKYGYIKGVIEGKTGRGVVRNTGSDARYCMVRLYEYEKSKDSAVLLATDSGLVSYDGYRDATHDLSKAHFYVEGKLAKGKTFNSATDEFLFTTVR